MEYIHHLYGAATKDSQNKYIFIVNKDFDTVKDKLIWEKSNNIHIISLNNKEQKKCDECNLIKAAWNKSIILKRYINKYGVDRVWLIMFMQLMPFLPILVNNKIKISGILYRIFLYEKDRMSKIRLLLEKLRYRIIINNKSVKNILVLNDDYGVNILNKTFKTDKFKYIPDPVPFIDNSKLSNVRGEFSIKKDDIVYLHFGGLCLRKGTLDIMRAIDIMNYNDLKNKVFVFAGIINNDIKKEFYYLKNKNDNKCRILVFDEFCSYEFINNLCYSCDCILIPYSNTNNSSGVIGYAGYFKKNVISPSKGLLGRLVNENSLGLCIPEINPTNLVNAILTPLPNVNNSKYQETHSIQDFINAWY